MMERLSVQIVEQGGVIVDYAGDGILAMWNARTKQPEPRPASLPGRTGNAQRAAGPERPLVQ